MTTVEFGASNLKPIGRPAGMPRARVGELYHAIRDKCADCMGQEDVRPRIQDCQAEKTCPLWPFRPYQPKK